VQAPKEGLCTKVQNFLRNHEISKMIFCQIKC
jgi:hypothetical protein